MQMLVSYACSYNLPLPPHSLCPGHPPTQCSDATYLLHTAYFTAWITGHIAFYLHCAQCWDPATYPVHTARPFTCHITAHYAHCTHIAHHKYCTYCTQHSYCTFCTRQILHCTHIANLVASCILPANNAVAAWTLHASHVVHFEHCNLHILDDIPFAGLFAKHILLYYAQEHLEHCTHSTTTHIAH